MTDVRKWVDQLSDTNFNDDTSNGLLVMDGFDECILGVCQRFSETFVVYDLKKVLAKLQADGMTEEDAREFFEYNQLGAWMGDHTPGFVELPPVEV